MNTTACDHEGINQLNRPRACIVTDDNKMISYRDSSSAMASCPCTIAFESVSQFLATDLESVLQHDVQERLDEHPKNGRLWKHCGLGCAQGVGPFGVGYRVFPNDALPKLGWKVRAARR
jgi:hypothetical protein